MIADRSCFGNDPQGSDPQNPTEPQESQETPNSEQNGSSGTENGTSGTEDGSPDSEREPTQRMNGPVSGQILNSNQNNSKIDILLTLFRTKMF